MRMGMTIYTYGNNMKSHISKSRVSVPLFIALLIAAVISLASIAYIKREQIKAAAHAYVFGYPLVIMDITKQAFVEKMGPENQLFHIERFPPVDFRGVVRPNLDTLYSLAWLNLNDTEMVLSLPAESKRYYLLTILDAWTNVPATFGTRQGTQDGSSYLLVGPQWRGDTPDGLELVRLPTNMSWILARIQTNGEKDYPIVNTQQRSMSLVSLADWRAGKKPLPVKNWDQEDMPEEPIYQLEKMSAKAFMGHLISLMDKNPPFEEDTVMVETLEREIVSPNSWGLLDQWAISTGVWLAKYKLKEARQDVFERAGWQNPPMELGNYGNDYALRAFIGMVGLGANRPEDAMYPTARTDADGEKLSSSEDYVIHFDFGETPPVNAFWSITLYDEEGYLVDNKINRYALGDRDDLYFNADGSLDLYIQRHEPAGERARNWLPSGDAPIFSLTARLYWAKPAALSGQWRLPLVKKQQ